MSEMRQSCQALLLDAEDVRGEIMAKHKTLAEKTEKYLDGVPFGNSASTEAVLRIIAINLAYIADVFSKANGLGLLERHEDDLK